MISRSFTKRIDMLDQNLTTQAYSTKLAHLADMEQYVGQELGLTEWVKMTQEKIDTFAVATEDDQWIHTDTERAKTNSPYKTTIAHGFLVLSLATKFCYECFTIDDVKMGVNYGLDKVRFPKATPSGSMVRGRISLMSFERKSRGARFKLKVTIEIEGQRRAACIAEFISVCYTA